MKRILLILLLILTTIYLHSQVIKGQRWTKPETGFGKDTANVILIQNANNKGLSGFIAILKKDSVYLLKSENRIFTIKNDSDICFNIKGAVYCVIKDSFFKSGSGGTTGEANTAVNVGTGVGFYKDKVGVSLRFRSLIPGYGIAMAVTSPNDVDFSVDTTYKIVTKAFAASIYATKSAVKSKTDTALLIVSKPFLQAYTYTKGIIDNKTDTALWIASKPWINAKVFPLSQGGTGSGIKDSAIRHLLPPYAGNGLKYLQLNPTATALQWGTPAGGGGGGVTAICDKYIRYDSATGLGGNSGLLYDYANRWLKISDSVLVNKKLYLNDIRILSANSTDHSCKISKNQTIGAYTSTGSVLRIEDNTASTGNLLNILKQGDSKFLINSSGNMVYKAGMKFIPSSPDPANGNFFDFTKSDGTTSLFKCLSHGGFSEDLKFTFNGALSVNGGTYASPSSFNAISVGNLNITNGNLLQNQTGIDLKLSAASATANVWTDRRFGIGISPISKNLAFLGTADFEAGMERNTTIATAGKNLTITPGGAASGGIDLGGGMLQLNPGLTTGMGYSSVRMGRFLRAISTGTTDNLVTDAFIITSEKPLTNNTADSIFRISMPDGGMAGCNVEYVLTVTNGTDMQVHSGRLNIAALRKGSAYTSQITDETMADQADAKTGGSALTETWSLTSGINAITVKVNFNSNLSGSPVLKLYYILHKGGTQTITQL